MPAYLCNHMMFPLLMWCFLSWVTWCIELRLELRLVFDDFNQWNGISNAVMLMPHWHMAWKYPKMITHWILYFRLLCWMKVIVALEASCLMTCPVGNALGECTGDRNKCSGARTCVEFWMWWLYQFTYNTFGDEDGWFTVTSSTSILGFSGGPASFMASMDCSFSNLLGS